MKTKIKNLLILVLASFVLVGCCTTHKTTEWEYKTVRLWIGDKDYQATLNAASNGGWKLLTVQSEQPNSGNSQYYIFERPKQ